MPKSRSYKIHSLHTACPTCTATDLTTPGMGAITIVLRSCTRFAGMYFMYSDIRLSNTRTSN